jgi:hypothetical protein
MSRIEGLIRQTNLAVQPIEGVAGAAFVVAHEQVIGATRNARDIVRREAIPKRFIGSVSPWWSIRAS